MDAWFDQLAHRLRGSSTLVAIAGAIAVALERVGYAEVGVIAFGRDGAPAAWAGRSLQGRGTIGEELAASTIVAAELKTRDSPVSLGADRWYAPLVGCGDVLGLLRARVQFVSEPGRELALVAQLASVRLAQLGMDAPLASHLRPALTERQHQVACLAARGCTNPEIAAMLGVSPDAVKKHLTRVLETMDVSNRTELAAIAGRWSSEHVPTPPSIVIVFGGGYGDTGGATVGVRGTSDVLRRPAR